MFLYSHLQAVEATVDLRYVTKGKLKTPNKQFNPETGQISLSLKIQDSAWEPRQGLQQWDSKSRIFTEVSIGKL